jgi:uncharacterized protein (TIGR00106 family)
MAILAEFSIIPMGKGSSVSPLIAHVMNIVMESGLSYKANPMGTVLEGDWDAVMSVIRKCHDEVMKDAERAVTSIRIDDRGDGGPRMEKKLESVEQKLGRKLNR